MTPTYRARQSKRQVVPTPHRGLNSYDALNRDGTWENIYLDRSELEPIPKTPGLDLTKPVQTRDGRPARILTTDLLSTDGRTLAVAAIAVAGDGDGEILYRVTPAGHIYTPDSNLGVDIINVPTTRTYGDSLRATGAGVNVTEVDGVITEITLA